MPRQPRIDLPGALYHVISRGIERRKIFRDEMDKNIFLRRFAELVAETKTLCFAWSLLPNHFHLLLSPTTLPLSNFMQRLLTGYAMNHNGRHKRAGHLFQNRYRAILCQEETYFRQLVRYIHRNPLLAELIKGVEEFDRYPWCGHSGLMGEIARPWQATVETLKHFGNTIESARKVYREYVAEDSTGDDGFSLKGTGMMRGTAGWETIKIGEGIGDARLRDERILGDDGFIESVLKEVNAREAKKCAALRSGWGFEEVLDFVSRKTHLEKDRIMRRSRGNPVAEARALVAFLCRRDLGMGVTEIGRYMGISQPATGRILKKGEKIGINIEIS